MPFGQVVIGPPGSGKTTYCHGMYQFMTALKRKVIVVNLDPANDQAPYPCAIQIAELVHVDAVMDELALGPNGGLIYAIEYLLANLDWLKEKLDQYRDHYVLFDCPGQVELYTFHESMEKIVWHMTNKWDYRLTAVHLVDSFHCTSASQYISVVLLSLSTMLRMALPHVNVLSKIDLIGQAGDLAYNLDFYVDVLDPGRLVSQLEQDPFMNKFARLNDAICELIDDYRLVGFQTLNIEDKDSVFELLKVIDKSNGFVFGGLTAGNESLFATAEGAVFEYDRVGAVQAKYLDSDWDLGDDNEQ